MKQMIDPLGGEDEVIRVKVIARHFALNDDSFSCNVSLSLPCLSPHSRSTTLTLQVPLLTPLFQTLGLHPRSLTRSPCTMHNVHERHPAHLNLAVNQNVRKQHDVV